MNKFNKSNLKKITPKNSFNSFNTKNVASGAGKCSIKISGVASEEDVGVSEYRNKGKSNIQ
jgi:hypothetical protein